MKKTIIPKDFSNIQIPNLLLVVVLILNSCGSPQLKENKPVLSVSILPQKYIVEKICGDQFTIQVLIPPGESPATYDPSPQQMMQLSKSRIYFLIGYIGFEKTWIRDLRKNNPEITFFNTSKGLALENIEDRNGDHSHGNIEPHIWMSPLNVKIIAHNVYDFIASVYPEKEEFYKKNLDLFNEELDTLHTHISNELMHLSTNKFIIYHPALTYFARDYNLIQIPIEKDGKEPTSRYMRTIIDLATKNNIKAILVQKQFDQQEASTIEQEINGKVITIDPLDYQWRQQMMYITMQLKSILK